MKKITLNDIVEIIIDGLLPTDATDYPKIRTAVNDTLDSFEKDGYKVNHNYNQDKVTKYISKKLIEKGQEDGDLNEGISTSQLDDFIKKVNQESGKKYELGGAYGNYELWDSGKRLEVGSRNDIYQYLIKNRFKTNEAVTKGGQQAVTDDTVMWNVIDKLEQSDVDNVPKIKAAITQYIDTLKGKGYEVTDDYTQPKFIQSIQHKLKNLKDYQGNDGGDEEQMLGNYETGMSTKDYNSMNESNIKKLKSIIKEYIQEIDPVNFTPREFNQPDTENASSGGVINLVNNVTEGEGSDEFFEITTPVGSEDFNLFKSVVNKGIDSHLQGFTKSKFEVKKEDGHSRLYMNFHKSELPILIRRLEEVGTPEADSWAEDIKNHDTVVSEGTDLERYEDVVFIQGSEAEEPLRILNDQGPEAALEYLKQWHSHGEHMGSNEVSHGADDKVFKKDGYIMSWNNKLDYIGLQYDSTVSESHEDDLRGDDHNASEFLKNADKDVSDNDSKGVLAKLKDLIKEEISNINLRNSFTKYIIEIQEAVKSLGSHVSVGCQTDDGAPNKTGHIIVDDGEGGFAFTMMIYPEKRNTFTVTYTLDGHSDDKAVKDLSMDDLKKWLKGDFKKLVKSSEKEPKIDKVEDESKEVAKKDIKKQIDVDDIKAEKKDDKKITPQEGGEKVGKIARKEDAKLNDKHVAHDDKELTIKKKKDGMEKVGKIKKQDSIKSKNPEKQPKTKDPKKNHILKESLKSIIRDVLKDQK